MALARKILHSSSLSLSIEAQSGAGWFDILRRCRFRRVTPAGVIVGLELSISRSASRSFVGPRRPGPPCAGQRFGLQLPTDLRSVGGGDHFAPSIASMFRRIAADTAASSSLGLNWRYSVPASASGSPTTKFPPKCERQ